MNGRLSLLGARVTNNQDEIYLENHPDPDSGLFKDNYQDLGIYLVFTEQNL